jgi:hypothetical protein
MSDNPTDHNTGRGLMEKAELHMANAYDLFSGHGVECALRGPSPVNNILELELKGEGKVVVLMCSPYGQYTVAEIMHGDGQMFNRMPALHADIFQAIHTASFYLGLQEHLPD